MKSSFFLSLLVLLIYSNSFATPVIVVSDSLILFPYTLIGSNSSEKTYSIEANDLKENLLIMAPLGYLVSSESGVNFKSSLSLTPQAGKISETIIYLKYSPKTTGCNNGILLVTSSSISKLTTLQAPAYFSLKFRVSSANNSDETVVRFFDSATLNYDSQYDAIKTMNTGNAPSMYTSIQDNHYAINSCPVESFKNLEMSLTIAVAFGSAYKLELIGLASFDPSISIYLQDLQSGKIYNYRDSVSYNFVLPSASGGNFKLFFLDNNHTLSLDSMNHMNSSESNLIAGLEDLYGENDIVSVRAGHLCINRTQINSSNTLNLQVYNLSGQKIYSENIDKSIEENYMASTSIPSGIYVINGICGGKKIQIKAYLD